jgi:hypothetical protein
MDKPKTIISPGMEGFQGTMTKDGILRKITGKQDRDLRIKAPLLQVCILCE